MFDQVHHNEEAVLRETSVKHIGKQHDYSTDLFNSGQSTSLCLIPNSLGCQGRQRVISRPIVGVLLQLVNVKHMKYSQIVCDDDAVLM